MAAYLEKAYRLDGDGAHLTPDQYASVSFKWEDEEDANYLKA
jgi:hypothetical protein